MSFAGVGHRHMECGGKRSATPLWLMFVPSSQHEPLSQSGVALRLPPHSIKFRSVTDSFSHTSELLFREVLLFSPQRLSFLSAQSLRFRSRIPSGLAAVRTLSLG